MIPFSIRSRFDTKRHKESIFVSRRWEDKQRSLEAVQGLFSEVSSERNVPISRNTVKRTIICFNLTGRAKDLPR